MVIAKLKNKWLLSYDNCNFISDLYKNFNLLEIGILHSAGKSKQGSELLISTLANG